MTGDAPSAPGGDREAGLGPALRAHTFRLGYGDTDPAGILYYAAWFPRMENLQTEYLYLNDLRQDTMLERFGWWTVSRAAQCEYLAAARLLDEVRIELRLGAVGRTSIRFDYRMLRLPDELLVARASNTIVTVAPDQSAIRVPEELRRRLQELESAAR